MHIILLQLSFILNQRLQVLLITTVLASLLSCSQDNPTSSESYDWNIWFYMNGDNDLSDAIEDDYVEIINSIKSKKINICIQIDLANNTPTKRFRLINGEITLLGDIGEVDMTKAESLTNFLTWSKSEGKAKRTLLVLSNHGNGWDQSTGPSPNLKPANRAMFSDSDNSKPPPYVYLHNHLVADAIEAANVKLDILGFDASLMSTIETLYEYSDLAPVLIASEEIGNANGWNYKSLLAMLEKNPTLSREELATHVVNSYQDLMENEIYPTENTHESAQYHNITALRSHEIQTLSQQIDNISIELLDEIDTKPKSTIENLSNARLESQAIDLFSQVYVYVDLKDFFTLIGYENRVSPLLEAAIIKHYQGQARPNANGLSIVFFMPDLLQNNDNAWYWNTFDPNYKNWDPDSLQGNKGKFINEYNWDELLERYYNTLETSSTE